MTLSDPEMPASVTHWALFGSVVGSFLGGEQRLCCWGSWVLIESRELDGVNSQVTTGIHWTNVAKTRELCAAPAPWDHGWRFH